MGKNLLKIIAILNIVFDPLGGTPQDGDHYRIVVSKRDKYEYYKIYSDQIILQEQYPKSYFVDHYDFIDKMYLNFRNFHWPEKPVTIAELSYQEIYNSRQKIWSNC